MDAAPARARAPIGWALQVACGQSLPRLSRHRGPVALVMQWVSTALRSGSLPEFASPWSSTMVRWSVPAFLLRTPGGGPPFGDPLLFRLQRVMTFALDRMP